MCLLEMTVCMTRGMPAGKLTYLANGKCTGKVVSYKISSYSFSSISLESKFTVA